VLVVLYRSCCCCCCCNRRSSNNSGRTIEKSPTINTWQTIIGTLNKLGLVALTVFGKMGCRRQVHTFWNVAHGKVKATVVAEKEIEGIELHRFALDAFPRPRNCKDSISTTNKRLPLIYNDTDVANQSYRRFTERLFHHHRIIVRSQFASSS
jgi:hypothetical protein